MKLKHLIAIAGFAMALSACDEGTENIGMSLTSSNDNINVTTEEFNVTTESFIPDSISLPFGISKRGPVGPPLLVSNQTCYKFCERILRHRAVYVQTELYCVLRRGHFKIVQVDFYIASELLPQHHTQELQY